MSPVPERMESEQRNFPLAKLFPNMITLGGLCCGLSSMRYALDARWELVVALLMISVLLDGLDGRIARMLNSTSTFGAQLDSLSDFVCFGVAPVITLYLWTLHDIKRLGWAAVMLFSICCALRLARFNTALLDEKKEPWKQGFFTGVPAPAGALLALLPMVATFVMDKSIFDEPKLQAFLSEPGVNIAYLIAVALLMVSKVPTLSVKQIHVTHDMVLPSMLIAAIVIGCFLTEPWVSFVVAGLAYIAYMPVVMIKYLRIKKAYRHE